MSPIRITTADIKILTINKLFKKVLVLLKYSDSFIYVTAGNFLIDY